VAITYTESLADLLGPDIEARVAASAMMGVHRVLIDYTRRRVLEGTAGPRLARDVRAQAERAFALLERGLSDASPRASRHERLEHP
jgi:hypothetical protein